MRVELPVWVTETPKKFTEADHAKILANIRRGTKPDSTDPAPHEGRVNELEAEWLDAHEKRSEMARRRWSTPKIAAATRELDDTEVVNACGCGRMYTAKTFHALPFSGRGVKEFTEDGVTTTEIYRNCVCGSTRMIFTEREAK